MTAKLYELGFHSEARSVQTSFGMKWNENESVARYKLLKTWWPGTESHSITRL
jgi:hypothetical protein